MDYDKQHEANGNAILWRRIILNARIMAFIEGCDLDTYSLIKSWEEKELKLRG